MIHVLIVDDIKLMAAITASVFKDEEDINVIGMVTTVKAALERSTECDILLVNAALENKGARELAMRARCTDSAVKVVIMGMAKLQPVIMGYIECGAAGYILKDDSIEELSRNIRAAYNDKALASPAIVAALMSRVAELSGQRNDSVLTLEGRLDLTSRESEALRLISKGLTNQEIADKLFIELGTVKNHVHSILSKLSVSSREEAAEYLSLIESVG